jgi:hypothetical protein
MIKFMVAALWISVVTTAAVVYSFQAAQAPDEAVSDAEANAFHGLDYVRTGVISVPIFDKGSVQGYFLARLVFTADGQRLAQLKLPAEALFADQVYSYLYANPEVDFTKRDDLDVDSFRESLRTNLNARLGEDFVREVLIEQVDYLPKESVGSQKPQNASAIGN